MCTQENLHAFNSLLLLVPFHFFTLSPYLFIHYANEKKNMNDANSVKNEYEYIIINMICI